MITAGIKHNNLSVQDATESMLNSKFGSVVLADSDDTTQPEQPQGATSPKKVWPPQPTPQGTLTKLKA
jgi:hypothetical protein